MMGIVVPETYWAYKKYNKIISSIQLVLILQPYYNLGILEQVLQLGRVKFYTLLFLGICLYMASELSRIFLLRHGILRFIFQEK